MIKTNHWKIILAVSCTIILWSSAFVGIRVSLQAYSPGGLALFRYLIASFVMLILYYRLPKRNSIRWKELAILALAGFMGFSLYNLTLNYGELTVQSAVASFIVSAMPVFSTLLAVVFLGERIKSWQLVGFLVAIFGVTLVFIAKSDEGIYFSVGVGLIVIATIAGAIYSVLVKSLVKKLYPIEVTAWCIWFGTLFMLLFLPDVFKEARQAPFLETLSVIYLGIFPAALGYLAFGYVVFYLPINQAAGWLYTMPFVTALIGWIVLSEVPSTLAFLGGVVAIVGSMISGVRFRKKV
jgi:drug/metabolite transporter (DMT)-like permease